MDITLLGQTPSQKNSKQMALNRATGKLFPVSNPIVKAWQKDVAKQLLQFSGMADGKVCISYQFYCLVFLRRDIDNLIASVNDALVHAGLIKDDSWQWLSLGHADAELDRQNPRCELTIVEI